MQCIRRGGLCLLFAPAAFAGVDAGIKNIHATFSGDPRREVTVSWRTDVLLSPPRIRLAEADSIDPQWTEYPGESGMFKNEGYNHHVSLTHLMPGIRYAYQVSGPGGVWGPECAFATAPESGDEFTFAVVGDVQGKEDPSGEWQTAGAWLSNQEGVAFTMITGDLVDTGYSQTQWDAFFNSLDQSHSRELFHSMVVMPVVGNHDYYGGTNNRQGIELYRDQFRLPPNGIEEWQGRYYAFDFLNARFVMLDTEGPENPAAFFAQQTLWVSNLDWKARPWIFPAHHRSVYRIVGHEPSPESRRAWRPHFFDPHAAIVFNGHNHSQAVTDPLRAERLHGQDGGIGFSGAWQAESYAGCPGGLTNLLLLEDNELVRYAGYGAVGRSVNTLASGALVTTAMQADRPVAPIAAGPGSEIWMGYLYEKKGGYYNDNRGGWRLSSSADSSRYIQTSVARVTDSSNARFGHFRISLGESYENALEPIAQEGNTHIPPAPFFVLARFVFATNGVTGYLKCYQSPEPLPESVPETWDAVVHTQRAWSLALDRLTLFGENHNAVSWIDEFRAGRTMEDVLLRPAGQTEHSGSPLIEERFDSVSTTNETGGGVVYYDAGGINFSRPPSDLWYLRYRQEQNNMPLAGLFTVTAQRVTGRTVFYRDFGTWSTGDVIDEFEIERTADTDLDGIPDWWEEKYFGGATNANARALAANGINSLMEAYIAGLNPTDPAAVFHVEIQHDPAPSNIVFQWPSARDRLYDILHSTNLTGEGGGFQPVATNLAAMPGINLYTNALSGQAAQNFFRIHVRQP